MRSDQLVSQFDEPLRRWFASRVPDPGDAEDLAQETMLAVLCSRSRFRGACSIRTWVYAIARNQLLKYLRGARRRPLPLGDREDVDPHQSEAEARAAERLAVQIVVSHLPLQLRDVYRLYYCEGYTTADIASAVRRSQGTVKYQLYEVRRRVREALR